MAFFLPLIGGLAKVAGGQAMGKVAKKAIISGAKGAARGAIGGGKGKGRKGGKGGGGGQGAALVKNMSGAIVESSSVMGAVCLLYTSPSPRDLSTSRMPSSA